MDYAPLVTLYGINGEQFVLSPVTEVTAGAIFLAPGAKGLDMPPWDVQTEDYPNLPGSYPTASRGQQREIFLPLIIWGETRRDCIVAKRRLIRALPPLDVTAVAKLSVAERFSEFDHDDMRDIDVYYYDGLDGDEGNDNGLTWIKVGLVLRSAGEPFYRAQQDTTAYFLDFGTPDNFFPPDEAPFVSPDGTSGGFQLSPNPTFTPTIDIDNTGDIPVYPTWNLVGPISGGFSIARAATNRSPEQTLTFNSLDLAEGESVTLVTEPGKVRLTGSTGVLDVWSILSPNPQFWALDPGANSVTISGLSANPQNVSLTYRIRYLGL